ncbi:MAG: hypothetical protein RR060_04795 [Victivallaceae bacterium]
MFSFTSIFKSRQTIFWIVIVLTVLLLVEFNIYRFYIVGKPGEVKALEMEQFLKNKVSGTECYNMVILGDSRTYIGLSPFEIATEVPGSAINLGYDSGGLNEELFKWVNSKRLRQIGEHRVVIMGISPYSLSTEARQNLNFNKYRRMVASTPEMTDKYGLGKVLRQLLMPINLFGVSAAGVQTNKKSDPNSKEERIFYDNGWNEWRSELKAERVKEAPLEYEYIFNATQVDNQSLNEVYDWTRRWSEDGVMVIGVRMPLTPELLKVENEKSGFDEATFRREFEAAGGKYLTFSPEGYLLFDGSHLEAESARRFSTGLGKTIAGFLAERDTKS